MKPLPVALLDAFAHRILGAEAHDPMFAPSLVCTCGHAKSEHAAASGECMGTTLLRGMRPDSPRCDTVRASCPCYSYTPAGDPGTTTARHGRARRGAPWLIRAAGWAGLATGAVCDAKKRLGAAWKRLWGRS